MKKTKDKYKQHVRNWKIARKILSPILTRYFSYEFELAPEIDGNYLVLANHNNNVDPFLCALSFHRQMYFLAGEQVFRLGFLTWFLKTFFEPISKIKGKKDATAIILLMKHLKAGHNCCLFAEGNRSFTGETGEIVGATGKLVKATGVSLVTYRFEGGYLTTPRWAFTKRKGYFKGGVVKVYSPEEIQKMTLDEINKIINMDLYENAYKRQEIIHSTYKGKRLAEGIEAVLYSCPMCKSVGTIIGKKNKCFCTHCGKAAIYTEQGLLEGDFPFNNILDWDNWQKKELERETIEALETQDNQKVLAEDGDLILSMVTPDHKVFKIEEGKLSLFIDSFQIETQNFLLSSIEDMSIYFRRTMVFSLTSGENYEVVSKSFKNATKYITIYKTIKSWNQKEK